MATEKKQYKYIYIYIHIYIYIYIYIIGRHRYNNNKIRQEKAYIKSQTCETIQIELWRDEMLFVQQVILQISVHKIIDHAGANLC